MNGPRDYHAEWSKSDRERQISYDITHMWNLKKWYVCLVTQLCPMLCDPLDYSLPGTSVCGDSPGKNTGVGCHALLLGIFPTQGSNPGLLHCRWILYHISHQGSPWNRVTDVEKKHKFTKEERRVGINWEIGIDIYTLLYIKFVVLV